MSRLRPSRASAPRPVRQASFDRRTTETQIRGRLVIDGQGRYDVRTGIRFFDHMLELFARHGGFDLQLKATGDLDVDQHHTVEDVGIVLGESVLAALGDRKGINRAGYFVMPMDETLAVVALDLGGRPHAVVDLKVRVRLVGDLHALPDRVVVQGQVLARPGVRHAVRAQQAERVVAGDGARVREGAIRV